MISIAQSKVNDNAIYLPHYSNIIMTLDGEHPFSIQDTVPNKGIYKMKCNVILISRNKFAHRKIKHKNR